jgi:hypothetical protein
LLDSADLDKATFSQDLLDKWNAEDAAKAAPLSITSVQSIPMPPVQSTSDDSLASLIK